VLHHQLAVGLGEGEEGEGDVVGGLDVQERAEFRRRGQAEDRRVELGGLRLVARMDDGVV